jgi:L-fuconolactonase
MTGTHRILDAHLHVWDLSVSEYAWLPPAHGRLRASFTPQKARRELTAAGVDAAILVQAEDSEGDTTYLLDVASHQPWVAGVVGWIQLGDPERAEQQLARWTAHQAFCGIRHLVHNDPRNDFLALPNVRRSLAMVAELGLPFDVPDAWPRHLEGTVSLARAVPGLSIVLDHLGKPPRDAVGQDRWRLCLRELAACPNTTAKVSGLQTPGQPFTPEAIRPAWDTAVELFGPSRLMYGGDWPMTTDFGGYPAALSLATTLAEQLSPRERGQLFAGTAERVYHRTVQEGGDQRA